MKIKANFFLGWICLTFALAFHVLDEALNDFLSVYNPFVTSANAALDLSVFPVFSFDVWRIGLILGILFLFVLSFFARNPNKWMVYLGYGYGAIMLVNAMGHFIASLYYVKPIAGVYSSPLLLLGSVYLIWSARHISRSTG